MGATKELFIQIQEEILNYDTLVKEGEVSSLEALIYLRGIKEEAEKVLENVKQFEDSNSDIIIREADGFGNLYNGYEIKQVQGRKTYNFKNIPEVEQKEIEVKRTKEQYQNAFEGFQKGVVQTVKGENNELFWVDADGEIKPFPDFSIGKSYLTIKKKK